MCPVGGRSENCLPPPSPWPLELLAPAADLNCGLAALDHGADAVYIGGPRFGARAAAGNSLADIERLVERAHAFGARVYVALNTLLSDAELAEAVELAHQCHRIGVDALIIQDMGLLEADLPPIALHASTQMDNRLPAKIRFLEEVGLSQVVLARELSLAEIGRIRAATTLPLEFFVHGSLCVSYSGRCYISELQAGRSANRGECAQYCRHRYTLHDRQGRVLARDRYLLSLKDLDLSAHLRALIDAGISSFKIEGRLKESNYVKNVTAHYRLALDRLLAADPALRRASSGQCRFSFTPNPEKSFHRGGTDYFLRGGRRTPGAIDSPKATGELLGRVVGAGKGFCTLDSAVAVNNGDGLCYFDWQQELVGMRVNRVEGRRIYLYQTAPPPAGTLLYRNLDTAFNRLLAASSGCRRLSLKLSLQQVGDALQLSLVDEEGIASETELAAPPAVARQPGSAAALAELAERQLRKCGGTIFTVGDVQLQLDARCHYPVALFNELRRQAFANHLAVRLHRHRPGPVERPANAFPWPVPTLSYRDNITNSSALAFFRRHGVVAIDPAGLEATSAADCALMTCRYCLRAQLQLCPGVRSLPGTDPGTDAPPLLLADRHEQYELRFDCRACRMTLHCLPPEGVSKG